MNFYQDIFFRGMDMLRGRKTIERLYDLRKSQHWTLEQIQKWQLDKLNELLLQATKNSPYYKDKLQHISLPLKDLKELNQLPVLTKDDIRSNLESIKCTNLPEKRFFQARTGGSTGEPMVYFWDVQGMDANRASVYRSSEWGNTKLGEKTVHMSGSHFDYSQAQSLKSKIVYFLQRFRDFNVAYLTEERLETYYQELLQYKPTSIWGYTGGIHAFAEYIHKNHPSAQFPFIKAIMTSSEMLRPEQREMINNVFGADKVYDQYGSRELYIASECSQHNGYHIHADVIIAEIVDSEGNNVKPGELGRVILTDLSNHAFPFIRYEIGDLGIMDEATQCECGMSLPKLKSVQGRIADVIILKDRLLTAPNFASLFSDKQGIQAYQIRQDKIDEINVLMVPDEHYNNDFENFIKTSIESMLEGQATLNISLVDEIEVPESGKRRYIISNVSKSHFSSI